MHILIAIKTRAITNAVKAIRLDVLFDTNTENKKIMRNGNEYKPIRAPLMLSEFRV